MKIRELSAAEFTAFAQNHKNSNFHSTVNYALLKSENNYEYEFIGYVDNDTIHVAALVLVRLVNGYLYAYIPEGFLMDYNDQSLLYNFTKDLYSYYKKESISFIKINPRIVIGTIDNKTKITKYNDNIDLIKTFENCGYKRLENNMYFETVLPRIGAKVDLYDYTLEKLSKNTKNKIRKGIRRGLVLENGNESNLNDLNKFVKRKISKTDFYYNDYYNIFKRDGSIDLFLVSIDYNKYIINSQEAYQKEQAKNETLNLKVRQVPGTRNINKKMNSDKALLAYKNDISIASKRLNLKEKEFIAAALVIKHKDTATILISGYDKVYRSFAPNYYLYYQIIEHYKNLGYKYLDLNGITADLSKEGKYHGLNQFKIGFNPILEEYIGEFDLIINQRIYNYLHNKKLITK